MKSDGSDNSNDDLKFKKIMGNVLDQLKFAVAGWYKRLADIEWRKISIEFGITGLKLTFTPQMKKLNEEIESSKKTIHEDIEKYKENPPKSVSDDINQRLTDIESRQLTLAHLANQQLKEQNSSTVNPSSPKLNYDALDKFATTLQPHLPEEKLQVAQSGWKMDFDKAGENYAAGKSHYLIKKDKVMAFQFFQQARTQYKALLNNDLSPGDKAKAEKRIAKLKAPDGKYCGSRLAM